MQLDPNHDFTSKQGWPHYATRFRRPFDGAAANVVRGGALLSPVLSVMGGLIPIWLPDWYRALVSDIIRRSRSRKARDMGVLTGD